MTTAHLALLSPLAGRHFCTYYLYLSTVFNTPVIDVFSVQDHDYNPQRLDRLV